jgi:cell division protein FtsN
MNRQVTPPESDVEDDILEEDYDLSDYEDGEEDEEDEDIIEDEDDDIDNEDGGDDDETSRRKSLIVLALLSLVVAAGGGYLAYSFTKENSQSIAQEELDGAIDQVLQEVAPQAEESLPPPQVVAENQKIVPLAPEGHESKSVSEPDTRHESSEELSLSEEEIQRTVDEIKNDSQGGAPSTDVVANEVHHDHHSEVYKEAEANPVEAKSPNGFPEHASATDHHHQEVNLKKVMEVAQADSVTVKTVEPKRVIPKVVPHEVIESPLKVADGAQRTINKPRASPSGETWYLQVSAESTQAGAQGVISQLRAKGYSAEVEEASVRGKTFYRVLAGPFERTQAQSLITPIRKALGRTESPFVKRRE